MGDQSLEKFRLEYEKLHRAVKKSHEQEKRLVKKCRELNGEIINNQAKIKTALRLSQEDQKTISHLQKEMEKTWKLVYMSQEKETRAKETIGQLKEEMGNLSKLVERGAGLSMNQENMVKELKQAREELQRQVDEQSDQMTQMEGQLLEQHTLQEELRVENETSRQSVSDLRERLQTKENESVRELKRREKTHKELQEARLKIDERLKVEEGMKGDLDKGKDKLKETERQLGDARATMDKYLRDYDTLYGRTTKVTEDLETQITRNKQLQADQAVMDKEMKLKVLEIGRAKTDLGVLERKVDKEHRAAMFYKQALEESKTPLAAAHSEIDALKKDAINAHRHELQLVKQTEKIELEKEAQTKKVEKTELKLKEEQDIGVEQLRASEQLGGEVSDMKTELQRLRKVIFQLEKDRERLGNEVGDQRANFQGSQEELKLREVQISEIKKRVVEWENKLRQQQQLYESVRADRNHYSKGLIEAQDEIAELRKKFKIMGHQIEQLKEEISSKDQALVKEHFDFQRAEKMRENVQNEVNRKNQLITNTQDLVHQQDNEIKNLTISIKRMDEEALAQRKEYDQVINERDILGMQLIRRNDELALLYEKLRVQHSALKNGELQYTARVDDIRLLRIKMKDLLREISNYKGNGSQNDDMRRDILHLQKELLQEKTKVTALSEELENPMNVHRWRKLEGSDPATFELIQKIQTLQRRLISKTEEVVEKGLVIQEKEKLYTELRGILSRQPGPEVAEQLTVYQQNLRQKTRQMKAMASELNMYQAQVNESKYESDRLSRELQEMKRKYYQQKRKDQMVKEMFADDRGDGQIMSKTAPSQIHNEQVVSAKGARTRFTGGGFAIK
jgi:chromosome segregation ATPase